MGTLVVIVLAAALGYYAWKSLSGPGKAPSCHETYTYCMTMCRGTTTEAPAAHDCQETCERNQAACERESK